MWMKILILGDSCRGKTTLAKKLSQKLKIKHYSTDDYYWKTKFSEARDKEKSIEMLKKDLDKKEKWILEGTTKHLLNTAIDSADKIIWLRHNSFIIQVITLLKRHKTRGYETKKEAMELITYLFKKRFTKRNRKTRELIKNKKEIIILNSFKKIDKFLEE